MPNRLVVSFDGTWNSVFRPLERENKTTVLKPANPLKLARAVLPIDPTDGAHQVTYYDSGVGALGLYPGVSNRLLNFADSKLGGGWGAGFEANVEQAVTFLCHNYAPETEVYVFGFSRGAAQARALTHFLSWMGGIPAKSDAYFIPLLFRHYLANQGGGDPSAIKDGDGLSPSDRVLKLRVKFLGVWDTVSALGARFRASTNTAVAEKRFHTRSYPADCVDNAYHAVSIDEQRFDFRPEIWTTFKTNQNLRQCWFAGSHGNVGGSYGNDGLANCALHWIVDAAKALGLKVDEDFLSFYRAYPQDELGDPYDFTFKAIEIVRFKRGQGKRTLEGFPDTANLEVHPSAIQRLCSDPAKFKDMSEPYRPSALVELAKRHKTNKKGFLRSFGLDPQKYTFPIDV